MSSFSLGVLDPALAMAIAENLHISCRSDDTVREILHGCRLHLEYFVKGLQATTTATTTTTTGGSTSTNTRIKAELGL